jgi:hypothetical protein
MGQLGQVGKRLQIIKIAISITDREAISLQHSKLRLYKNDKLLQNILLVLDDENYAQASNLINRYLHGSDVDEATEESISLMEEQRVEIEQKILHMREKIAKKEKEKQKKLIKKYRDIEEEELINQFGLFREKGREEIYNPIAKEEMKEMEKEMFEIKMVEEHTSTIPSTSDIMASFDSIKEDIPVKGSILDSKNKTKKSASYTNNEEIDPAIQSHELFFSSPKEELVLPPVVEEEETPNRVEPKEHRTVDDIAISKEEDREDIKAKKEEISNRGLFSDIPSDNGEDEIEFLQSRDSEDEVSKEDENIADEIKKEEEIDHASKEYEPISYIDQKLRNMLNQYPQIEETTECFKSEERLLYMISLKGYTEEDIEKVINDIQQLKSENKLGEASHLLLTIATTESLYAQFTLARELYQGVILVRDLPEAFTQINYLATENYPEAVCDLAQFYEHGIGIKKDKKKALSLYKKASELGVSRASTHLTRLEKELSGIFGKLFK